MRRGALVLGVVGMLITAIPSSASASVFPCEISGSTVNCTTVTGIDPGSRLRIRSSPSYSAPAHGSYNNGDKLGVDCWVYGDPDADGHGWRYWMYVDSGLYSGYVNDWYLTTGSPSTWAAKGINPC